MELEKLGLSSSVLMFIESKKSDISFDNCSLKGSTGTMLFGEHKLLKKRVAFKFYYYENGIHEEVELLASIRSNNILSILDAGTIDEKNAYFMTDEINAGDLDELINTKKLSYKQAILITKGILVGLVEMHKTENRLLHRDLKPANILLSQNDIPLIADFGSVKRVPDKEEGINASRLSLYRPPEAYENYYTYSSDIYQVGLLLYKLLGGYLPNDPKALMTKKEKTKHSKLESNFDKSKFEDSIIFKLSLKSKLLDMNTLPPYVDDKIKSIIRKSTQPNYLKRYSNCSEFIHALHQFGPVENWYYSDDVYTLIIDTKIYKIEHQKHNQYACMKSLDNGKTWKREIGIKDNLQKKVVYDLKNKIKNKH